MWLFILAFFYLCEVVLNKIILFKYETRWKSYSIDIHFDKENIHFYTLFNTYLNYSYLDGYFYFRTLFEENIIKKLTIIFTKDQIPSYEYQTNIRIQNDTISNYKLYISEHSPHSLKHVGIGVAYKFNDESYSLVHLLYNSHIIEKREFAFGFEMDSYYGKTYIGGIPDEEKNKYKIRGYCNVDDNHHTWGFTFHEIRYEGKAYSIEKYAYINNDMEYMIISQQVFEILKEVLKDEIRKADCTIEETNLVKWIKCRYLNEVFNGSIQIKIDNMILTISLKKMFKRYNMINVWESKCVIIKEYTSNDIILGDSFLQLFNYTLFDYDNKKISFYTEQQIIKMNDMNSLLHKLLLINSVIGLSSIIMLIIINYCNKILI